MEDPNPGIGGTNNNEKDNNNNSNTNNDQSYNEERSEEEQHSDEDVSIHNNIDSPYSTASSANILKRNSTSGD